MNKQNRSKWVKRCSIAALTALIPGIGIAQDQPHFSMYMYQPSVINPAAMGSFDEVNGAFFFNKNMIGFDKSPMTGLLDIGIPIGNSNAYAGFQASQDRIGVTTKTMFAGNFAYRIRLNMKHYLSLGMGISANLINATFTEVPVQDPNDPVFSSNVDAVWYPDIKLGAYYFSDNVYVGFTVGNIFTNSLIYNPEGGGADIRFSGEDMHYYLTGGWQKKFGGHWKFRPSALLKFVAGTPLQVDINANFMFRNAFGFGVSYRTTSTIVANVSYTIKDFLVFGYAFNMGLAYRDHANFTGHEALVAFRIRNPKRIIPVDVPRY